MKRRSLRLRLVLIFGLGSLLLSSLFSTMAFLGVRKVLISDQQQTDLRQSYVNAALVRNTLYTAPLTLVSQVSSIQQSSNATLLVQVDGQWQTSNAQLPHIDISPDALTATQAGNVTTQTRVVNGHLVYVVGIPMRSVQSQVFEIFPLDQLDTALRNLLLVVGSAALLTTLLGISGGIWVSRRTVRPLVEVAQAAAQIAEGDLNTRLPTTRTGSEVETLTTSFNAMVSQLVTRIERDARFASDVSHELRSPLTALAMSASIIEQHRGELPKPVRQSVSLLSADLAIFQTLVEDLIEISRSDAGANNLVLEDVRVDELVRQSVRSATSREGSVAPELTVDPSVTGVLVRVDRRRFQRVIANLFDNADRYAAGVVAVTLTREPALVVINVDDDGPGIAPHERELIFGRFFRGRAAHDRTSVSGTGLGLALVHDHVAAFGGRIVAEDSPQGGARFRIELPIVEELP